MIKIRSQFDSKCKIQNARSFCILKFRCSLMFVLCILFFGASAQQTPQYTQFMLNNYGMNPAACGAFSNKLELLTGVRRQWVGFEQAPVTAFFNFNTYIGNKGTTRINSGWHGIGAYWQGDRQGTLIKTDDFYASYTYLLHITRSGFISFGMAVGARRYGLRINDITDPVLAAKNVWIYPDIIPGVKFFNTNWTFDLSFKQLYKYKAQQGGDMVGSPTKLPPHLYFSCTRKWWPRAHLLIVQSLQFKYTFAAFPSLDYGMLAHLSKNFAVGLSYRHFDAVSAVVQYRLDKLVIGVAYDYSIAPYRIGFADSQEYMLGLAPSPFSGGNGYAPGHYRTAECPTFQY